jgi:hypothetical protein
VPTTEEAAKRFKNNRLEKKKTSRVDWSVSFRYAIE